MPTLRNLGIAIAEMGVNPLRLLAAVRGIPVYLWSLLRLYRMDRQGWRLGFLPVFGDRYEGTGTTTSGHYFHVDLWAARLVHGLRPDKIVDVGSRIDGYVAHILVFHDIEVLDVRPLTSRVKGLTFRQVNAVDPDAVPMNYADCVSCLHALEHFGLGRYGDDVDFDAWRIGFRNLARMVKLGGSLLLAVPVGRERIEFNAHRVFDPDRILREAASLGLSLESYSFVDDSNLFHESVDVAASTSLDYGCGCFHFIQRRGTDHSTA